jgi:hypothetical protein
MIYRIPAYVSLPVWISCKKGKNMLEIVEIVEKINNFSPEVGVNCIKFYVDFVLVGLLSPKILDFVEPPLEVIDGQIHFQSSNAPSAMLKTIALERLLEKWRRNDAFPCLRGWRNERYCVYGPDSILLQVERAACGLLGVRTYGTHLNGYVQVADTEGSIMLWVGKRSMHKATYPGMLDQIAAGGMGVTEKDLRIFKPDEVMMKEAYEEAGIPLEIVKNMKCVGCVTFWETKECQVKLTHVDSTSNKLCVRPRATP